MNNSFQWPGVAGFDPSSINFGLGAQAPQAQTPFALPNYGFMPTTQAMGAVGPLSGAGGGPLAGSGLGFNMPTFNLALGGLSTLGNLWGGLKQLDLAKKQLAFSKNVTNTNLANQTASYNTTLEDRARARGAMEGQTTSQVSDYIARNSLPKRTVG